MRVNCAHSFMRSIRFACHTTFFARNLLEFPKWKSSSFGTHVKLSYFDAISYIYTIIMIIISSTKNEFNFEEPKMTEWLSILRRIEENN